MLRVSLILLALAHPLLATEQDTVRTATSPVKAYIEYLDALDNKNFDSIYAGIQYFKSHLTELPEAQRDTICWEFINFFIGTISYNNDLVWEDYEFISQIHDQSASQSPDVQGYINALHRNGLDLYTFGRLYYIDQQHDYLYRHFAPYVSSALQDYLALRASELETGFSDSDSLLITFQEVGERAIRWERYLDEHPVSVAARAANYYYQTYRNTFLTGLRLSPVFDSRGALRSDLITLYPDFISRHYDTDTAILVREFYISLVKAGYHWSQEVRDFYVEHQIRNMHTAQLPYR